MDTIEIRQAQTAEVPAIARIAAQHNEALGFVRRVSLEEAQQRDELLVAIGQDEVLGFCEYHRRKDDVAVVYAIAVATSHRRQGLGRALLANIPDPVRLKCPTMLSANNFYAHIGFRCVGQETGKRRALNVWQRGSLPLT